MPRVEAVSAVNSVWAKTLASYKKDLSKKDLLVVEAITSPTEIANHIESLEAKTHAGKSGAFADRVHAITGRLTQFSNLIDTITSSNTEASLIWGSLKLLLTIVHKSSEEYERICKSVLAVSSSFPIVQLMTETFSSSELVCGHIADLYTSVLRFWSKALRFYKRRRVFNIFRAWHDFDSEFGDLDRDMKRYGKMIEKAATAVHMNESRMARLEQRAFNDELMNAKQPTEKSYLHRDIVNWLAPLNYEATYFVDDLRSASESRHPGTCTWILVRPEFHAWLDADPNDAVTRLLWLTGVPGAGKTVLSSFVIKRCSEVHGERKTQPIVYFFFKLTDTDKSSVLAVTRSLMYQLYSLYPANLAADIIALRDNSGKERALSEQGLWDLFVKHTRKLTNLTIVLDALDECEGVDVLLRRVILLLQSCGAKICLVSRKEKNIALALAGYPKLVIGHEDVEADIRSYVTAEIKKIPRFQGKSIQQRMINGLSSGHGGMFLWAYLMVKELKELGTVRQVDDALKSLPRGLEDMHEAIITRLDSTLHRSHRDLATKILAWIVCAARPLRLPELQEILRFEVRQGRTVDRSSVDDDDDDDLLYSEKDIELACGALVMSRNETLQLIHLSTKEILTRKPLHMHSDDSRLGFYVNTQRENPRMAVFCVSYISSHLEGIESITRPDLETVSKLSFSEVDYDSSELITKSPFMNYASISWQVHLTDGKINLELEDLMVFLQTLLTYDLTILWIELCVSLHQDVLFTLERSCAEIMLWADYTLVPAESSCHGAIGFMWAWSNAVASVINEYACVIVDYPYEIHYLDLERYFSRKSLPGPAFLPATYAAVHGPRLQESISQICDIEDHQETIKVEPHMQLQSNLQNPGANFLLGFVLYDSIRDVFFSAESYPFNNTEVLQIQDRATGRRLVPAKSALDVSDLVKLVTAVLCPEHKYLAILYGDSYGHLVTSLWIIERHLDFQNIRDRRPWARRLHCVESCNLFFANSCLPLTVGQDGLFYCPSGQMHPERGICRRIPNCFVDARLEQWRVDHVTLTFSGNGQNLFRLHPSSGLSEKISWLENTVADRLHPALQANHGQFKSLHLRAISQTARFGVYEGRHVKSSTFFLCDTQENQQKLQIDNPQLGCGYFYFSRDEQFLIVINVTGRPPLTHFSRWALTGSSSVPQAETSLFIPNFGSLRIDKQICVVEEYSEIILVNENRVLYQLDLKHLTFKEDSIAPSQKEDLPYRHYCERGYELARNGHSLIAYYVTCPKWSGHILSKREDELSKPQDSSKSRIELRFIDLCGTADQVQRIELKYFGLNSAARHSHFVEFSPDLSLMQVDGNIFDLKAPGNPPLSFSDSLRRRLQYEQGLDISFSPCNGYLTVITGGDLAAEAETARFECFQIFRTARRIEKIVIDDLEYLVAYGISVKFHPIVPLLLITCITSRASDIKAISTALEVLEIDLQELKPVSIVIPTHNLCLSREECYSELPDFRAEFSSCGSFCFFVCGHHGVLMLDSIHLGTRQANIQVPTVWARETSYNGQFYSLGWRDTPRTLNLSQAISRTHRNGSRDWINVLNLPQHTIAVKLTAFPSHLAFADVFLLIGKDENDLVRILFLPEEGLPEIKHLRVTLNQILAKMEEAARAVEPNIEELFQEEWDVRSEDHSGEVESEKAVMSCDGDELGELDGD